LAPLSIRQWIKYNKGIAWRDALVFMFSVQEAASKGQLAKEASKSRFIAASRAGHQSTIPA
jgi:hypothetical protein